MGNGPETPAYVGAVAMVRELIADLPVGTQLPSIREKAAQSKIPVAAVRKAYEKLRDEGLLISMQGKGWFTAEPRPLEPDEIAEIMRRFDDLTEELRKLGERVDRLEVDRGTQAAQPVRTEPRSRRRSDRAAP
jgi:GntR family transcriptional regulator